MIKFWTYLLALMGLVFLSYPIHEAVHWGAAPHPTKVCLGLDTHNSTNPFTWAGGQVYYNGGMPWYGSEWVAYGLQGTFILIGMVLLIKKG